MPIVVGDTWKYFKGTAEPAPPPNPPTWATVGFDDSLWLSGPSGFGYGPDGCMAQVGTTLADMRNTPTPPGYFSIYARKKFDIVNPAAVTSMTAVVDYDDSVIVYVNGTEVGRSTSMGGTAGTPTTYDTAAASGHECSVCDTPPCIPAQSFTISPSVLVAGTNVIAIHAHNQTLASSDFILIPTVSAVIGCSTNEQCSDNDLCNGLETCVTNVCQPGTALNCADANVCTTDSCSPTLGCQNVNNAIACNDGLTCTTADVCAGGICAGAQINCNDGVACTTDTCLEGVGCQNVPGCPGGGSCNLQTGACTAARMECSPSTIPAGAGSTANLIVVLENLGGLAPVRGYQTQIAIARTSGTGTVSVECPGGVAIDDVRPDYLFAGSANDFPATNCALRRASSSLLSGGVTVGLTPAYLSSYTLTTSLDAAAGSTFTISLDAPVASSLVDQTGQALAFDRGPACTLTIASCATAGDCDDGNPCTVDTCDIALGCQHTPGNGGTVCRASAGACDQAETCTGTSAACPTDQTSPNGTACNDGNACTQTDTCQAGACTGANPVTCTALDQCHVAGTCDTGTGLCSNPNAADGVACSDGNACTQTDTCQAGACVGAAPVVCNDSNPCTDDTCSAGACVYTVNGLCGVSGTVRYYRDDSGAGLEPSTKPVPNVGIDRTADTVADATTGSTGTYAFGSLSGNVTLTTVAKFGTPRASDHNGAIGSFDASVIARAGASLLTLTPNQQIAGDVTGNGTVGAFDASFVARFAAGLIDHFDVATTTGSDWKFVRCDAYAFPGDPGCGSPAYAFTPITQAEPGKNFYAILYGDVTGNWQPAAFFSSVAEKALPSIEETETMPADLPAADQPAKDAVRNPASPPAEVSIDRFTTPLRFGERRELTIRLDNADGILGLDLDLKYDATRIKIVGVRPAGIATGWGLAHADGRGAHRITTYGVQPLAGSGTAIIVTVEGAASAGSAMPIQIDGIANEGTIPLRARRAGPAPAVEASEDPSGDR